MPTSGWILEAALDAYYEGTERISQTAAPSRPTYKCPFCNGVSESPTELDRHVIREHSVARPFLLLRGHEPSRNTVVRSPISPSAIHIANTTNLLVTVDNRRPATIERDELGPLVSRFTRENVVLTLSNASKAKVAAVTESYKIQFRIARITTLTSVEAAFRQIIAPSTLSVSSIRAFLEDSRCYGDGEDYAEALSRYAMGILRKEDPESANLTTPSSLYREDYVRAQEDLREVPRPMANLISQLSRFALNDFDSEVPPTGHWELDLALRLMRGPSSALPQPLHIDTGSRYELCLDHGTGQILNLASRMSAQERWSPLLSEECRLVVNSEKLYAVDQQKAAAIWAACAWRLGAKRETIEPLHAIANTYPFSLWAAQLLDGLT